MQLKHLSGLSNTGIVYYFIYFFGMLSFCPKKHNFFKVKRIGLYPSFRRIESDKCNCQCRKRISKDRLIFISILFIPTSNWLFTRWSLKFIENLFVSLYPAHVNNFDFRVQLCIATFSSVHIHFFGDIGIPWNHCCKFQINFEVNKNLFPS